jgi:UDP-glucose 4-epimerase
MNTQKRYILVTGGCGYIGTHTIVDLIDNGYTPLIVDDLSNSNLEILERVKQITGEEVEVVIDSCQSPSFYEIFTKYKIEGIIHFAAFKSVNESVNEPLKYYENNLLSLINVLDCAQRFSVHNIVFSSSCSLYGNLKELPAKENSPLSEPESPYARTKLICEQILSDFCKSNTQYNVIALRYFNPVGAHESGLIGESPINKPNNILPVICNSAESGDLMTVFGDDYSTRDGSCIRDYIHVMDLANAHTKAIDYLTKAFSCGFCGSLGFEVFNIGSDKGISVFEIINAFERENEVTVNYQIGPRREGDIEAVWSDSTKAFNQLNWKSERSVEDIVKSAWKWHNNRI